MIKPIYIFLIAAIAVPALGFITVNSSLRGEQERITITKNILDKLVEEDYEEVRKDFHSSLKNSLPAEKIAEVWQTVIKNSGKFQKILSTKAGTVQEFNQVRLRLEFSNENATLETVFNEDDKVVGLWIKP